MRDSDADACIMKLFFCIYPFYMLGIFVEVSFFCNPDLAAPCPISPERHVSLRFHDPLVSPRCFTVNRIG